MVAALRSTALRRVAEHTIRDNRPDHERGVSRSLRRLAPSTAQTKTDKPS